VEDFTAAFTIGLDVAVRVVSKGRPAVLVHSGKLGDITDAQQLLIRISFAANRNDKGILDYISRNHHRIRPVRGTDGTILGMAAVSDHLGSGPMLLGIRTVGGLPTSLGVAGADSFIGYLDYLPSSAKRDSDTLEAPKEALRVWGEEQLEILEQGGLSDYRRCIIAAHITEFGVDPIEFARVPVTINRQSCYMSYQSLALLACAGFKIGIMKTPDMDHADTYTNVKEFDGVVLIQPIKNSQSCTLEMTDGEPEAYDSIIGCLHRAIRATGKVPKWELQGTTIPSFFGRALELLTVEAV
jgi:hypothetical protein